MPLTWEEFAANNDALLEAGITPVGASFGTTWTSQLFVLADYYNIAQEVPDFAERYTANEAHYADTPAALRSFERLQEAYDSGWWNEDYRLGDLRGRPTDAHRRRDRAVPDAHVRPLGDRLARPRRGAEHRLLRPARRGRRRPTG